MAFQKKYYFNFKDINDLPYTVEIWQNTTTTISATEIRGSQNPIIVDHPESMKFEPVRGSGCEINLLSQTDCQFLGLYSSDIQEYQVRLYYSGTTLKWTGFLDTEIYEENFSEIDNYNVTISGNDGFALLDRLYYVDNSGNQFTGLTSQFDILKYIIQKINLPFLYTYIYLSTTVPGMTLVGGETVLNKTYVSNSNFYNEDAEPETLRTVLESILRPYGAFITQDNGSLFITDVNQIAQTSLFQMERYYGTGMTYIDDTGIDADLGDLSNIKFTSSNQSLTIISGVNKEIVTYSPYKHIEILNYDPQDDIFSGDTMNINHGTYPTNWVEKLYTQSSKWSKYNPTSLGNNNFAEMTGRGNYDGETDRYLIQEPYNSSTNNMFTWSGNLPYIIPTIEDPILYNDMGTWEGNVGEATDIVYYRYDVVLYLGTYYIVNNDIYPQDTVPPPSDTTNYTSTTSAILIPFVPSTKYYLQIEADGYVRTSEQMGGSTDCGAQTCILDTKLTIGNKKYKYVDAVTKGWVSTATSDYFKWKFCDTTVGELTDVGGGVYEHTYTKNPICDKWLSLNDGYETYYKIKKLSPLKVPLFGFTGNTITFSIGGFTCWGSGGATDPNNTLINSQILDFRLKNIVFTVVDALGNEIKESDIEYIGFMDKSLKNEGESIDLILGSNLTDYPIERGGLLKQTGTEYNWIENWTRNTVTDNIENLLLRSYVGNYNGKSLKISCMTNKLPGIVGTITYENFLSGKIFMIVGSTINFAESTTELVLEEVFQDSLTIKKSF